MLSPLTGDQMSRNHLKKQRKESEDFQQFFHMNFPVLKGWESITVTW